MVKVIIIREGVKTACVGPFKSLKAAEVWADTDEKAHGFVDMTFWRLHSPEDAAKIAARKASS